MWEWVPGTLSGAGILLRRMFRDYPPDKLWALTSLRAVQAAEKLDSSPGPDHLVGVADFHIPRRWIWRIGEALNRALIPWIAWQGVRLIRREKIQAIFAVQWGHFYAAAYLMHKLTKCPLYFYAMDDHEGRHASRALEPPVYAALMGPSMRAARRVWSVSEGMRENLLRRFGKDSSLLLPTADVSEFEKYAPQLAPATSGLQIAYTGAVYGMQLDALANLVRIVDSGFAPRSGDPSAQLTLYTSASASYLAKIGLPIGSHVRLDEVKHTHMPQALAKAHIAFLPMSFDPEMKHVVSTSIPSKISEYLASGVPILAHGPAYCSAVRYCREFDCALVVDQPDEAALREALQRLATDQALREKLSRNAREAARRNHDARVLVPRFLNELADAQNQSAPK